MKTFATYITEAIAANPKIAAIRTKVDAIRQKMIGKMEAKLDGAKISAETRRFWKQEIESYRRMNLLNIRSEAQLSGFVYKMENALKHLVSDLRDELSYNKDKELVTATKPITICDILKSESPKHFVTLMTSGAVEAVAGMMREQGRRVSDYSFIEELPWVRSLGRVAESLSWWFELQGGSKQGAVNAIRECMACKGRAAWTKWDGGKVYRGVGRSIERIKRYTYTGEMIRKGDATWLVASVKYKGKYGAQSWTPSWGSATGFEEGGDIQVVLEIDLAKDDTFLRPEVVNKVSGYKGEEEVIRVSDRMVPAKAYVKLYDIVNNDAKKHPGSVTPAYAKRWAEGLFGAAAAKKLLANRRFMKEVGVR